MNRAFVLMTAMPPTKGHGRLIEFAAQLADRVTVIVCTQPGEPYPFERFQAVQRYAQRLRFHNDLGYGNVDVVHLHRKLLQDPDEEGFWEQWEDLVGKRGLLRWPAGPGDIFVTSEPYGARLAEITGATFMPYDPKRELLPIKATAIREGPYKLFADIMPEFQPVIRKTITLFGAESTGKTTLSKELAAQMNGHWLYEYARPYLETVGPDITVESMTAIWKGQAAVQRQAQFWTDKPFIIQDTDLFSTVGYWDFPHWQPTIGETPEGLVKEAHELKSDLYVILRSNIPFEEDPIRYGGTVREGSDEYWEAVAIRHNLNYVVINESDFYQRFSFARKAILDFFNEQAGLEYDRHGL